MKKNIRILFCSFLILWWCGNLEDDIDWSFISKNAIVVSELPSPMMTSGLSFDLLPIDGCNISPSPTDEYNTVVDFLFVDHNSKKIGIHFFDFMPNKDNLEWESSMNNMGVPYNNIYPALKNLYINEEKKTNAKILSTTRTILLSTYLRSRFWELYVMDWMDLCFG